MGEISQHSKPRESLADIHFTGHDPHWRQSYHSPVPGWVISGPAALPRDDQTPSQRSHHSRTRSSGNSGESRGVDPRPTRFRPARLCMSARSRSESPRLPTLGARASSLRSGRRGLRWSTAVPAWLRPGGFSEAYARVIGRRTRRRG